MRRMVRSPEGLARDSDADLSALAILTSFNRNFKARNDGNRKTMNFLASPDIVTAMVAPLDTALLLVLMAMEPAGILRKAKL